MSAPTFQQMHLDLQSTGGVAEHRAAVAAILRGSEVDTSDEGQVTP